MALACGMIAMSDNEDAFGLVECFVAELLRAGILIFVCFGLYNFGEWHESERERLKTFQDRIWRPMRIGLISPNSVREAFDSQSQ
jgi:hypothetical protein